MEKLMIVVGVNENVMKSENPNVPVSAEEISDDIAACVEAGASFFHFHTRDQTTGAGIMSDPEGTLEIYRGVRAKTDAVIYPSYIPIPRETRFAHIHAAHADSVARPEFGPVIAGEMTMGPRPDWEKRRLVGETTRTMEDVMEEIEICNRYDLAISHDIFDPGQVRNVIALWKMDYYQRPCLLKFFFRPDDFALGGFPPEPQYLEVYAGMIPDGLPCEWLALPYGGVPYDQSMALWTWAIENGGHVRVGIGDNPQQDGPDTNAARVKEIADLAQSKGRAIATAAEVRERFARISG